MPTDAAEGWWKLSVRRDSGAVAAAGRVKAELGKDDGSEVVGGKAGIEG
jgi:hypothetical protein